MKYLYRIMATYADNGERRQRGKSPSYDKMKAAFDRAKAVNVSGRLVTLTLERMPLSWETIAAKGKGFDSYLPK